MNGPCGPEQRNASEPEANLYKKVSRDRDIPLTLLPVLAKNKNAIAPQGDGMDETRCTLPYGTDTDIYNITHSSTKSNPRSIWRGNRIRLAFHLVVRYNNAIKYPLTVSTVISSRVSKRLKADLPLGAFLYMGLRATRRGAEVRPSFHFL